MSRSTVRTAFLAVAALFVVCVVIQFMLAGLGVFESHAAFITHRDFGYAFGWLTLVMLVLAIVGRLPRRQLALSLALLAAFAFQSVFVAVRSEAPVVAALHPLNGALILVMAAEVTRFAWRTRGSDDARVASTPRGALDAGSRHGPASVDRVTEGQS
jgi:hypothetical protein